jgi:Leucine-rich repeat (LRR) protein
MNSKTVIAIAGILMRFAVAQDACAEDDFRFRMCLMADLPEIFELMIAGDEISSASLEAAMCANLSGVMGCFPTDCVMDESGAMDSDSLSCLCHCCLDQFFLLPLYMWMLCLRKEASRWLVMCERVMYDGPCKLHTCKEEPYTCASIEKVTAIGGCAYGCEGHPWVIQTYKDLKCKFDFPTYKVNVDRRRVGDADTQDIQTLVSIADAVGVDFWGFPVDFTTTMEEACKSARVKCDESSSMIVGIVASFQDISAPLSAFAPLGNLKGLATMELAGNSFHGELPAEWASLANLEKVYLDRNELSGQLPKEWASLANLKYVNLQNNLLTGALPKEWASLANLEALLLSRNKLSGELPAEWSSLQRLTTLYLQDNALTGALPAEWASLQDLVDMDCSRNILTGTLPKEWASLQELTKVELIENALTGTLPKEWASLQELQTLRLGGNKLSGELPGEWSSLQDLYTLDLNGNALTGTLPAEWASLESLYKFELHGNALTGALPKEWAFLPRLQTLRLSGNKLSGALPVEWASLANLQNLYLQNNSLTGQLPKEWASFQRLAKLYLFSNKLSGELPAEWASLVHLQYLYLQDNALTGALPKEWASLQSITDMDLSANKLSGTLPSEWASLRNVISMKLHANAWTGGLPKEWASLQNLQVLWLNDNELSGELPGEWALLGSLEMLMLNSNALSGELPGEWGLFKSLQILHLSSNALRGQLPRELSNLTTLQSFDVSSNLISGGLEHVLTISTLLSLDASANLLTGSVSFIREAGRGLVKLVLSGNHFDGLVFAADFAMRGREGTVPLVVDLRDVKFTCPFPTAQSIRDASGGSLPPLVLSHHCGPNFRVFIVRYTLPCLGGILVGFVCWKLSKRYDHSKYTSTLNLTAILHFGRKALRVFLFWFMLYDNFNDMMVYRDMMGVAENDTFDNPCAVVNNRGLWYNDEQFSYDNFGLWNDYSNCLYPTSINRGVFGCVETNFTTFAQYMYYIDIWVDQGVISQSSRDANVDAFTSLCADFYVVDHVHECSYNNATAVSWIHAVVGGVANVGQHYVQYEECQRSPGVNGSEGCQIEGPEACVRVRNMEQEKNRNFKSFIVASIVVFAVKEFAKVLYVLFVWLHASTRQLQPLEVALVGESPLVVVLLWSRPGFMHELLFTTKTWKSALAFFFIEDVLEGANQLALVIVFSVTITREGIDSGIMFSVVASVLKVIVHLYALAKLAWKTRCGNDTFKVHDESVLANVREKALDENSLTNINKETTVGNQ